MLRLKYFLKKQTKQQIKSNDIFHVIYFDYFIINS